MAAATNPILARRNRNMDSLSGAKQGDSLNIWTVGSDKTVSHSQMSNGGSSHLPSHSSEGIKRKKSGTDIKAGSVTFSTDVDEKKLPSSSGDKAKSKATFGQMLCSWRFVITILLHFSLVVAMLPRFSLAMSLVCMVRPSTQGSANSSTHLMNSSSSSSTTDHTDGYTSTVAPTTHGSVIDPVIERSSYEFDWSSEMVGILLSAPNFSSFIGPLLSDFVRRQLGNKVTMLLFLGTSSCLSFLSPVSARFSPYMLLALAILQGLSASSNIPIMGDTLAWWSPTSEKLTLVAIMFAGANVGGITASFLSGFLCSIPIDKGWPFIFYVFGSMTAVWCILWCLLSSRRPEDHRFISETECQFIVDNRAGMDMGNASKPERPPYRTILTSRPVIGFVLTGWCHVWVMNVTFAFLPVFFSKAQGFPVEQTGILVAIIGVVRFAGSFCWTATGNFLLSLDRFSTNKIRKLCIAIGFGGSSVSMFALSALSHSGRWVVFAILLVAMVFQSVGSCTLTVVPLDMAPRYAGFITGIFFSTSTLVAISGPLIISALTPTNSVAEWQVIWAIIGVVFLCGALSFVLLGQASLQPWAQANRKSLPNIVSPFVTLGRRFSTFAEAPPLSPVSPISNGSGGGAGERKFHFGVTAQIATLLSNMASSPAGDSHVNLQDIVKKFMDEIPGQTPHRHRVDMAVQTDQHMELEMSSPVSADHRHKDVEASQVTIGNQNKMSQVTTGYQHKDVEMSEMTSDHQQNASQTTTDHQHPHKATSGVDNPAYVMADEQSSEVTDKEQAQTTEAERPAQGGTDRANDSQMLWRTRL